MLSRQIARAESTRARILALGLAGLLIHAAHAAPAPDTRTLKTQLARIAAMPAAPRIADDDFSRRPRLAQVKLSPDGAWLAWLETSGQTQAVNLLELRSGRKKTFMNLAGRQQLHWSGDSTVIFIESGDGLAALTIADGASSRIAVIDRKTEQQFAAVDPSRPHHALMSAWDSAAKTYRITRVGADGASKIIYEARKRAGDFLLDAEGEVAFVRELDKDFSQVVMRRVDGKWAEATRCRRLRPCDLLAASGDKRYLTMAVNRQDDRKALVKVDLRTGSAQVLHTDPLAVSDLEYALVSAGSRQPLFAVYDAPLRRNYGLTPAAKRAAADIAARFPDSNITIGANDTAPRWLLTERGARIHHDRFWTYDVATRRIAPVLEQERKLGESLPEEQLAYKIPLQYRASDGAMVHGYLSLPPRKQASALPLLTVVHGGPWGRLNGDYNPLIQTLANRGYAVFMPNFRASTGHGDKYTTAPRSDFGNGRIQADIIDGVRWLLANGVGDKERLGILGDSFGGYSTLLALTHTPGMFKFGMAMVPPTDFARVMVKAAAAPAQGEAPPMSVTLAEAGIDLADAAAMKRIGDAAPAANADKVMRPLLILAGGKDQMVDVAGVTDYVARLQGLNKPVTLLLDADEGHNPRKPLFRQAYGYLLQRMGHEHLGGPAPAAPSAELAAYLKEMVKVNGAMKGL